MNEQLETEALKQGITDFPDHRIRYFSTLEGCTDYITNFNIKGGEFGWNEQESQFILVYRNQQ